MWAVVWLIAAKLHSHPPGDFNPYPLRPTPDTVGGVLGKWARGKTEPTDKLTLLSGSIASGESRTRLGWLPSALQHSILLILNPTLPSGPQVPRQPRTAPRGLKAAQRPPLASANAQSSSWPSLPKARALQPIVDVDLLETAYPSSGRTTTGGLMSYSKLRLYSRV